MTNEEAIRIINSDLANYDLLTEARRMTTEALEKQIPKKPNQGACPCCGFARFGGYDTMERGGGTPEYKVIHIIHCEWCGQAVDWSKDD